MRFEPGRDGSGRTPLLEDGKPAFAVCGHYYISRAVMPFGIVSDAWYRPPGAAEALALASGVKAGQALQACEAHANGILTV